MKTKLTVKLFLILTLLLTTTLSAMQDNDFKKLITQFKKESFASDKINFLKTIDNSSTFTSKQVSLLIKEISFASDKMKALKLLLNKMEDKKNINEIVNTFSFDDEKKKVRKLLDTTKTAKKTGNIKKKLPLIVNQIGAWETNDFNKLLRDINKESFSDEKIKALKNGIKDNNAGFNSKQAIKLIKSLNFSSDMVKIAKILDTRILGITSNELKKILTVFSFGSDKLKALEALKNTITDIENKYVILSAFSFSGDKEKARKILETIKPRSLVYGLIRSKNIVFVVDISGSMEARFMTSQNESTSRLGFVINEIKKVLIEQMDKNNNFNIIVFNNKVRLWKTKLVKANPQNVKKAINFLDTLSPRGGTNIYDSLKSSINLKNIETVYFLTDGMPTAGRKLDTASIINDLKSWNKDKKIIINTTAFLIGKFNGDNEKKSIELMKSIAKTTNGVYRAIDD